MARILDFYEVRWEYEPTTFPILWNLEGEVIESFAPDFYLPDLDLFLEMTTLRQRLVRKKNRKLRRLRELYPDIRIKLFYARDFRAMMLKYGRLGLAQSLSGTSGQVVPDRSAAAAAAAARLAASVPTAPLAPAPALAMPSDPISTIDPALAVALDSAGEPGSVAEPTFAAAPTEGRPRRARRRRGRRVAQEAGIDREAAR